MPPRGRPSKATKGSATETAPEAAAKLLPTSDPNPPKLWILPETLSKDAQIITLAHPRSLGPSRYYHCPETGLHEIKRIAAPPSQRRSVLLWPKEKGKEDEGKGDGGGEELENAGDEPEQDVEEAKEPPSEEIKPQEGNEEVKPPNNENEKTTEPLSPPQGYVLKTAEFFTVTPIDPLFLILPALSPKPQQKPHSKHEDKILFLSADDILENFFEHSKHLEQISQHVPTREKLESRMAVICDQVEAGDEKMYRLNIDKLMRELFSKAERMSDGGLPESMEQQFVKKALEVPLASLLREEEEMKLKHEQSTGDGSIAETPMPSFSTSESQSQSQSQSQSTDPSQPSLDSQASISTTSTTITVPDTSNPIIPASSPAPPPLASASILHPTPQIIHLLRLRTALSFIMSSYVPQHLASAMETILSNPSSTSASDPLPASASNPPSTTSPFKPPNFTPLTTHLNLLAEHRAEVAARAKMISGGRKRSQYEEEEEREAREEKKRKVEEEEKRKKAGESRGVRNLKKVDVTGVRKISEFFKKK